jgi:hypothetical protein
MEPQEQDRARDWGARLAASIAVAVREKFALPAIREKLAVFRI